LIPRFQYGASWSAKIIRLGFPDCVTQRRYHGDAERIVDTTLDEMVEMLAQARRVELCGFGAVSFITTRS
jgi:hypothetical protein